MSNWTPGEWAAFLTALGTFVGVILSGLAAFLANLAKIRSEANAKDIEANTQLTKEGTNQAVVHAKEAADIAAAAKSAAEVVSEELAIQLNGILDERITRIVKEQTDPLFKAFAEHNTQDERNMQEIRKALQDLKGSR